MAAAAAREIGLAGAAVATVAGLAAPPAAVVVAVDAVAGVDVAELVAGFAAVVLAAAGVLLPVMRANSLSAAARSALAAVSARVIDLEFAAAAGAA